MLSRPEYRDALAIVAQMDRTQITAVIRRCRTPFPIDFTDDWLASRTIEELRHVLAAICLHCEIMPPAAVSDRAA